MRVLLALSVILLANAASQAHAAIDLNYPWCADYSGGGGGGGGSNCGFSTYAQCMATVSGIGGFCNRNTQYQPSLGGSPRVYRSRHRHYRQH